MTQDALLILYYFSRPELHFLEESAAIYGDTEEHEAKQLAAFLREASGNVRAPSPGVVRVSHSLRIFIGSKELKMRPMAKTVLLLFLRHPEGILLKRISDYRKEMTSYYRRVTRSMDPGDAGRRIDRLMDIFSNELNVNISRVNAAMSAMVPEEELINYRVSGRAGQPKSILLDRTLVIWE